MQIYILFNNNLIIINIYFIKTSQKLFILIEEIISFCIAMMYEEYSYYATYNLVSQL